MKVILNKDVKNLGFRGQIVDVAAGYFRNFLYPRDFAVFATKNLTKLADERNSNRVMREKEVVENIKDVFAAINGKSLAVKAKVNDKGTLFAAISVSDVLALVKKELKMDLSTSFVVMDPIKELGEHKVKLNFRKDMVGEMTVLVEKL